MMRHRRSPAVQHRGDADASAEMLLVGRDGEHGLCRGGEQEVVDHRLVLVGDIADCRGQCEDDVEVWHGQQFRRPRRHPFTRRRTLALRAVAVAAAVVGDGGVGAGVVLAAHDVPAEGRRAAVLDRAHHLELAEAHVPAVGVTPNGAVVAEDIRDLQGWTTHEGSGVMPAAPPSAASADRAGSSRCAARWWRRGYSGRSCRAWHGPAAPESPARRYRFPADAWRTSAAAYAA